MAKHNEFTAPESNVSALMPTSAAKYEKEISRRTDETVAVLATATDVQSVEVAMADMTPVIGTDSADNLTARQVEARRSARRTLMRAALEVADFTGKDAKRIFGVNATNLSQIKRGMERTAAYDALGIADEDRWSITDREKKTAKEWDAHLTALTATDDDVDGADGEADGEDTTSAPKPKTAAQVIRAITAAHDALAGSADMDDAEAMDVANALAALVTEATAQGIMA